MVESLEYQGVRAPPRVLNIKGHEVRPSVLRILTKLKGFPNFGRAETWLKVKGDPLKIAMFPMERDALNRGVNLLKFGLWKGRAFVIFLRY